MRFSSGGRALERLAGPTRAAGAGRTTRWPAQPAPRNGTGPSVARDVPWLRSPAASAVREALQQTLLFPAVRIAARPRVTGADELMHTPQPAVIAPNHSSDIDTPLVLAALPYAWRSRTVVGAAADRFYRRYGYAVASGLWFNTFPFDRGRDMRGLAEAAELLRGGRNLLLYPQGTRSPGELDGFQQGIARVCLATGAPIVPVRIEGTALVMPMDRVAVQRGNVTIAFGRAIYPQEGERRADLTERLRAAVAALGPRKAPGVTGGPGRVAARAQLYRAQDDLALDADVVSGEIAAAQLDRNGQ